MERLLVGGGEEELTVGGSEEGLTVGGREEGLTVGGREEGLTVGGREEMVGEGEEVTGALSLKLLTWPHTGKMTEVSSCCGWKVWLDSVDLRARRLCTRALGHCYNVPISL